MKEEQLKKIIQKSDLRTSDSFVDELMRTIEQSQEVKKSAIHWPFQRVLMISAVLVLIVTYFLFQLIATETSSLGAILGTLKIPLFITTTFVVLFHINSLLKLHLSFIQARKTSGVTK